MNVIEKQVLKGLKQLHTLSVSEVKGYETIKHRSENFSFIRIWAAEHYSFESATKDLQKKTLAEEK